jgi:hypothetical protein
VCVRVLYFFLIAKKERMKRDIKYMRAMKKKREKERTIYTHTHALEFLSKAYKIWNKSTRKLMRRKKDDITFWYSKCRIIRFIIYNNISRILLLLFKWEEFFFSHTHITRLQMQNISLCFSYCFANVSKYP